VSSVSSVFNKDAEGPEDCGSEVFIAEDVDGVGDKGPGDTTTIDVGTVLEAILGDFQTRDYFPQLPKNQQTD
jgi:hypothetical protein